MLKALSRSIIPVTTRRVVLALVLRNFSLNHEYYSQSFSREHTTAIAEKPPTSPINIRSLSTTYTWRRLERSYQWKASLHWEMASETPESASRWYSCRPQLHRRCFYNYYFLYVFRLWRFCCKLRWSSNVIYTASIASSGCCSLCRCILAVPHQVPVFLCITHCLPLVLMV